MCASVLVLGLSSGECRVLGADVALGTGRRLEGHGAAGALVEDFAVSGLNVRLDGIQPSKHHLAAGASAQGDDKKKGVTNNKRGEKKQFTQVLGRIDTPVSDTPGEVQTGLLQVRLKARLPGNAAALRANVRRSVFVDPLVGGDGAGVRQHHGW